jgi:hypothetical protein
MSVWLVRYGENGFLAAYYLHLSLGRRGRQSSLLVRREVCEEAILPYCLFNELLDTACQELAMVQAQRFFIEHSFRNAKSKCGMADYQVRRWDA